jgi:pimeloyl-ACP methyl ester carboxylesterase
MNNTVIEKALSYGVNLQIPIRHSQQNSKRVVLISNGYNTWTSFRPIHKTITTAFTEQGFDWIHYLYPERTGSGHLHDLYISTGLAYLRFIHSYAVQLGYESIGLFGMSFGGNISMEASLSLETPFLILANPVFDYYDYRLQQIGSANMISWGENHTTQLKVYDTEIWAGHRFIVEATRQNLFQRAHNIQSATLAFQGEKDAILSTDQVRALGQRESELAIGDLAPMPITAWMMIRH